MEVGVLSRRNSRYEAKDGDKQARSSSNVQANLQHLLFSATYRNTTPKDGTAGEHSQVPVKIALERTFLLDAMRSHIGAVTTILACHIATGNASRMLIR
jgi:hypothetical protein